jgi:hypothetical protein
MADTGTGATLTLAETGSIGVIQSMTLPEFALEALDVSSLASTVWMEMIPSDLADPGEIVATVLFDGATAVDLTSMGEQELITVTFPKVDPTNTAATLTATGFVKGYTLPELNNEIQTAEVTIQLDGGYNSGTVPTWTAEA